MLESCSSAKTPPWQTPRRVQRYCSCYPVHSDTVLSYFCSDAISFRTVHTCFRQTRKTLSSIIASLVGIWYRRSYLALVGGVLVGEVPPTHSLFPVPRLSARPSWWHQGLSFDSTAIRRPVTRPFFRECRLVLDVR